ncbi:MAG: hypothetical protein PVF27_02040 [Gemmatimonadales bacterium]|jgi:hypothetical protein
MNYWIVSAAVLLLVWVVTLVAVAPATGWVHVPLAAGTVLLARGLMGRPRQP